MRNYNDWIFQEGLGSNDANNLILDLVDAALYELYDCTSDDLSSDMMSLIVYRIRNAVVENCYREREYILLELSNCESKRE